MNQVVRLTSTAPAAIAVLQLTGPGAESWIRNHWIPHVASNAPLGLNHIRYGTIKCDSIESAGESIVVCKTGADTFELHCHGGSTASQRLLDQLARDGFEHVTWSKALASSGMDKIAMEATEDVLRATSMRTTAILLDQKRGALRRELESAIANLREQQIDLATKILQELHARSEVGMHLVVPWKVVLAGPPNVGKSSLLNAILGYQRAIVHESAGTTRDLLREQTSVDGWPIQITDSAGVHSTDDEIELQGIESSLTAVEDADCVLLLVAPEQGWTEPHHQILTKLTTQRVIVVATKADVAEFHEYPNNMGYPQISTSLKDSDSIASLLACMSQVLVPYPPTAGSGVPFRIEHEARIRECISSLKQRELHRCIEALEVWLRK
ncbi:MAG: GTPase [Pirellula sp.]|jgi:tRNA modification GTPase|nr:50S ribosome-binding GTPase [Pirellula sp.]